MRRVLDAERVLLLQRRVREVPVAGNVLEYAARLVRATRPGTPGAPDEVARWVRWGAGPRAGQALVLCAKARALLHGRHHVAVKDIQSLAKPILRHRVLPNFYAEAEGITSDRIVDQLLDAVPLPASGL